MHAARARISEAHKRSSGGVSSHTRGRKATLRRRPASGRPSRPAVRACATNYRGTAEREAPESRASQFAPGNAPGNHIGRAFAETMTLARAACAAAGSGGAQERERRRSWRQKLHPCNCKREAPRHFRRALLTLASSRNPPACVRRRAERMRSRRRGPRLSSFAFARAVFAPSSGGPRHACARRPERGTPASSCCWDGGERDRRCRLARFSLLSRGYYWSARPRLREGSPDLRSHPIPVGASRRPGRSSAQHAVHRASHGRAVPHRASRPAAAAAARSRRRAARRAPQAAACARRHRRPPQPCRGCRRAHPRRRRVALCGRRRVPRRSRSALPLVNLASRLCVAVGRLTRSRCRSALPDQPPRAPASSTARLSRRLCAAR